MKKTSKKSKPKPFKPLSLAHLPKPARQFNAEGFKRASSK